MLLRRCAISMSAVVSRISSLRKFGIAVQRDLTSTMQAMSRGHAQAHKSRATTHESSVKSLVCIVHDACGGLWTTHAPPHLAAARARAGRTLIISDSVRHARGAPAAARAAAAAPLMDVGRSTEAGRDRRRRREGHGAGDAAARSGCLGDGRSHAALIGKLRPEHS